MDAAGQQVAAESERQSVKLAQVRKFLQLSLDKVFHRADERQGARCMQLGGHLHAYLSALEGNRGIRVAALLLALESEVSAELGATPFMQ